MPTPKALHSKKTPKWGTPQWMIELARTLLGHFDLDPGSSEEFNAFVRAHMIYTEKTNGLAPECIWAGNIFCNPPGGLVNEFWTKLCNAWINKYVEKAFWVGFSVEQLCTLADASEHPLDFSTCVLRKRLSFNEQVDRPILGPWVAGSGNPTALVLTRDPVSGNQVEQLRDIIGYEPPEIIEGGSPSHGNYVTSLGCDRDLFTKLFSPHGKIYHGRFAS